MIVLVEVNTQEWWVVAILFSHFLPLPDMNSLAHPESLYHLLGEFGRIIFFHGL